MELTIIQKIFKEINKFISEKGVEPNVVLLHVSKEPDVAKILRHYPSASIGRPIYKAYNVHLIFTDCVDESVIKCYTDLSTNII